jgi:acyl-CoA synthetase (AMP-forming)/AMP-acid ligase II
MRNLVEMLCRTAQAMPDKPGVSSDQATLTWAEFHDRACLLAAQLGNAGVRRGDRVAIYMEHSVGQALAIFATAMADAAFTLVNTYLKTDQITFQVADTDVKAAICAITLAEGFEEIVHERGVPVITVDLMGLPRGTTPEQVPHVEPAVVTTETVPTDVGCIIYTSGSSGRPKGVVMPVRSLLDGARIVSGYLGMTKDDTIVSILPYSFDYGLNQLLSCVHTGARLVIHQFRLPQDLLDVLVREKATGFAAVPTLWPRLFDPRFVDPAKRPSFESLRYITTAGGIHAEPVLERLAEFFPTTDIIIMYGLTESFRTSYLPASEVLTRIGSIGKAVPEVEVLVLDDEGNKCPPGVRGELIHRGAFVSYGYLNNPELNEQKFVELPTAGPGAFTERAVRSGDIVSLDEDGYIYYHGRADLQIKSHGYRVSPSEVEEAVLSFPGISHAAAVGIADPDIGQAIVVGYTTYDGKSLDDKALRAHLRGLLPYYSVPRTLQYFEDLPATVTGKIDYAKLQSMHETAAG